MSTLPSKARGGTRLAFRLARRIALETPGRSALIVLLIALPIVGLSGVDTVEASSNATPAESAEVQLGHNEAMLQIVSSPDPSLRQSPLDPTQFESTLTADGSTEADSAPALTPQQLLPSGIRTLPVTSVDVVAKTRTGLASFTGIEGETWNSAFAGRYDLVSGVAPKGDHEILVSPSALSRFGISLGQSVTVTKPRAETLTVVGTMTDAEQPSSAVLLYGQAGALGGNIGVTDATQTEIYLPTTSLDWGQVRQLNARGAVVLSRDVILNPPSASAFRNFSLSNQGNVLGILYVSTLGAFALFEVCLLAGAAFAVGGRHQQRMLAILSSVGAERRILFRVMSFGGILLGFMGGLLGTLLGLAAAWIAMPTYSDGARLRYPGFHVDLPVLALIVSVSVISGWIAAAVPARAASRVNVVAALRGAHKPPQPNRRRPLGGVVMLAVGTGLSLLGGGLVVASHQGKVLDQNLSTFGTVLLVVGPVTMQVGVILILPLLLTWAMRLLARIGAGGRLAARDAARNPSRTVPAIAAVMSTIFVSAFIMCLLGGSQSLTARDYQWQAPLHLAQVSLYTNNSNGTVTLTNSSAEVASALNRSFGTTKARVLASTPDVNELGTSVPEYVVPRLREQANGNYLFSEGGTDHIMVGSPADLAVILGEPVSAASLKTLNGGGVISLWQPYVTAGTVTLDWYKSGKVTLEPTGKPLRSAVLSASVQHAVHEDDFGLFMLPSTADREGIHYAPSDVVLPLPAAPTSAEQDALNQNLAVVNPAFDYRVELGPSAFASGWAWALLALATLISLGAAVIALSLARADGRQDDGVLDALGAAPLIQRSFQFWQAIIITGVASVIGVGLALVPALALGIPGAGETHGFVPFAPPVAQLVLTAIGIPIVIAVGAWLVAKRRRVRWNVRTPIG